MLHASCFPLHEPAPPLFAETAKVAFSVDDMTNPLNHTTDEESFSRAGLDTGLPWGAGFEPATSPTPFQRGALNQAAPALGCAGGEPASVSFHAAARTENEVRGVVTLNGSMSTGLRRPVAGPQVTFQGTTVLHAGRQESPRDGQIEDTWRPLGILVRAIMDGSAERKAPRPRCRIHWL